MDTKDEAALARPQHPSLAEKSPVLETLQDKTDDSTTDNDVTGSVPDVKRPADNDEAEKQTDGPNDSRDDENIVFWDGDKDPQNPYNWPTWLKVLNCVLVSSLTFLTPLGSSMFAPGVPELMVEFGNSSSTLGSFVVSVYVLGFAAGPMIFAPLSELYGRLPVYHATNVCFFAFTIACAKAPSFSALVGFRLLAGLFGSVPMTNGGGTIADMIVQEKRGMAMSVFSIGPLLGPIVGPVAGGYLSEALGWRWVFWLLSILSGTITILFALFARETYAPVLLNRKAAKLRKETGNNLLRSKLDPGLSSSDFFKRSIIRPCKLLAFSPICVIASVYVGIAYAYMYLMFGSITPLFMKIYGFGPGEAGLSFLGLGVGSMVGVIWFSIMSDKYIKKKAGQERIAAAAEGRAAEGMKPEYRLPPLKIGAFLLPAGLFLYGWTADYSVHWIAPIIGTTVVGVAQLLIFMPLQMYLVDSFQIYAASALASNSLVRSIFGAVIPLAAFPMFDELGLGWGNSLLGFIACLMIPAPWLVLRYGEYLRKRFEIKNL